MIELSYDRLDSSELQGRTQADHLVALDAHLVVRDGSVIVFEEPGFPVVELARALLAWLATDGSGDFVFRSMSYEDDGTLAIVRTPSGWTFTSVLEPTSVGGPVERSALRQTVERFVAQVESDLATLGADPAFVLS